jgi:hypothetical protein
MTTPQNDEIKNQLRVTYIIFFALMIGMLLFFAIVMVLIQDGVQVTDMNLNKIFTFVVPVFGLVIMFISRTIYNQMINKFDRTVTLLQKISNYRTAKIISWAIIESACFFALVATMLTSNYLYVAVFVFLLGYFFLMRPSKESLIRDMSLNSDESDLILKS